MAKWPYSPLIKQRAYRPGRTTPPTGHIRRVATNPDGIYTLVKRHGQYMLEVFDRTALLDSVYTKTAHKTPF